MELLEDLKILHLLNDEGCFYLVLVGWMGDIMKHRFRVFTAAEREKQWKVMMKWLNGVEDQWGPKTTAALMQVASTAGLTEACITLYFDATKKGYATRYVLPSVVYALGKSGKMSHLDNAREVFNFCAENSFRREDYVAFIHANARQGNWRDARYYFEAFRKDFPHVSNKGSSSPQEAKLLTTLLAAYSRGRNPTGALELYQEFSDKYRLSDMQCSAMISAYADGSVRGYNAARMTFLRSYDITYTPSATAWMKVMTALAQSLHDTCLGEPRDAVEKMMLLNIRQGNDYIQTTQFQGRARYRYRHLKHRFWKLYEILKAYPSHYQPDHVTYYQSLKFAMVTEDPQAAMMVLDDAEKQGIRHTVFFNLAIGAHAKAMDVKGVLELFKKLRERKLVPDIGTYASIVQSLGPGVGTNNAVAVVENITKANMKMSSTFLAGCVRAFSTSGGMQHMAEVLRKGVNLSSGDDESDYVLDNPFLWHNLELAFLDTSILNQFHVEYPDFNERVFEVLGGPLQHFRSPRPVATNIDDFKQIFSVASGKSVWVMTDEWILPLGDRLREYIEDVLKAKDKVVIPFYCLLRLGKIVRRNSRNSLMREMAFKSLTVLQELFDESAEQAARGENVTVDTVYFTEEQWARSRLVSVLERQGLTERDLETLEKFKETPIVYDLELRSSAPVSDIPTVKALSRRSILVAHLIHQFQLQGRTQVFFCARNQDHLALAKDLGLETLSVEDVLGKGWLKQRIEEDEQLMLSWRAPDPTLAIDKPAVEVAALTATSFNANEYEQSLLHQVALESAAEREEKLSAKRKVAEEAKELKEEYAKFEKAAAGGAAAEAEQAEVEAPEERKQKKKKKKAAAAPRLGGMAGVGQASVPSGGGFDGMSAPAPAPGTAPGGGLQYVGTAGSIEEIQPGCVVLRGFIPLDVQQRMLDACFEKGKAPDTMDEAAGFFQARKGEAGRLRLNQGNRGRLIHPVEDFPAYMAEFCQQWVRFAQERDPRIPDMSPSTVLVNFYNHQGAFKWHRDTEEPSLIRAGKGKPIVSVSIGEACDFGIKDDYDGESFKTVRLDSGDILLFGGPARMIVHSVLRIIPNTRPPNLRFPYQPGRLNITFREVDGVIDTSMFPAYRVKYDIEEEPA
eukprot:TRINITY_DN21296_c1_g1_i1.p1 TRINITY_DN21296_c1_g1~~TRINITY_DN21296_c1_g1_i1.p1  ORF type:complete len:1311 (+),score=448.88 TRINITY_DN21296_c1_g1_i1:541-3933(+)